MKIINRIDNILDWLSVPRNQLGLKYIRIVIGWILVYIYTVNYAQRFYLFGPNGVYTKSSSFSLFHVSSPVTFDILYHMAIVAALCFAIGIGGRVVTLINLLLFWSWTSVALLIGDGGDNLLRVMLPYLLFTDLCNKLKVNPTSLWKRVLGILHNFGLAAVVLQLCFVYITAGLMKIQGGMWLDGTALYYIMQVDEFRNPLFSTLIVEHPWLSVLGAYSTIFFQIAFPFLVFQHRIKLYVIGMSILFHLGIWIFMNLPSFSWIMIAFELSLISDNEYNKLFKRLKQLQHRIHIPISGAIDFLRRKEGNYNVNK